LDETVSSTASATSSAPSLNLFTDYLRDSTISLQQVQSAPIQHRIQRSHYTNPTSVPQELYLPASDHQSISTHTAKLSPNHSMWNVSHGVAYGVYDGYHVGNMHPHNNNALSHIPPAHSGILHQPHEATISSEQVHMIDHATLASNRTSMPISQDRRFGRGNPPHPLTPPPIIPADHVECIEDNTSDPMHPGFMYSQVDAYHTGNPWLNGAAEQYHAVYGKLTEDPVITPATLAQNYQLQLELTSSGDWLRSTMYC
jgi:hypothetical protein